MITPCAIISRTVSLKNEDIAPGARASKSVIDLKVDGEYPDIHSGETLIELNVVRRYSLRVYESVQREAAHVHHQLDYTWPDRRVHWKQNCQSTGPRFLARHRVGNYCCYRRWFFVGVFGRDWHQGFEHLEHDCRNCGLGRRACDLQCVGDPPRLILQKGNRTRNQVGGRQWQAPKM